LLNISSDKNLVPFISLSICLIFSTASGVPIKESASVNNKTLSIASFLFFRSLDPNICSSLYNSAFKYNSSLYFFFNLGLVSVLNFATVALMSLL